LVIFSIISNVLNLTTNIREIKKLLKDKQQYPSLLKENIIIWNPRKEKYKKYLIVIHKKKLKVKIKVWKLNYLKITILMT
jgi:hypothetical protein